MDATVSPSDYNRKGEAMARVFKICPGNILQARER